MSKAQSASANYNFTFCSKLEQVWHKLRAHRPAKAQPIGYFLLSKVEQICCKLGGSFTATGTNVEGTVS